MTVADGGGSPTDIISVSTDIFAPSQIQVMSLDQADNQVIEASVLLLCSSIQHMVEYGAKEKMRSPDFTKLIASANKVKFITSFFYCTLE